MDIAHIAEELGLDTQTTQMFIDQFLKELQGDIHKLTIAIDKKSYTDIEEIAHYIKGTASNLRFETISNILSLIERAAAVKNREFDYTQSLNNLKNEVNS